MNLTFVMESAVGILIKAMMALTLIVIGVLIAGDIQDAYRSGLLGVYALAILCLGGFIVAISYHAKNSI